jgi:hypothetical protein
MRKPKVGDIVRFNWYMMGRLAGMREAVIEEYNYCLGFYGEYGPKSPCNFTPLSSLYEAHPEAEDLYWSNYGPYKSDYIRTFEIIAVD